MRCRRSISPNITTPRHPTDTLQPRLIDAIVPETVSNRYPRIFRPATAMSPRSLNAATAMMLLPALVAAELTVSGVDGEIERNVRAYVSLASEPCDAETWLVRRRFRSAETEARKALAPFGFYQPTITSTLTLDESCWHATLTIDPGEAVRLQNVDIVIEGAASDDPGFDELMRPASLVPGADLRHADYDRFKRALQIRAADRGYIEAGFIDSRLDIWPEAGVADIRLHFNSGPRYRVGEIHQEQAFLEPALVSGYLDLETGAPFDSKDLARAYRDLSGSGYFDRIDVVPDPDKAANGRIPIRVSLQPGDRIEYTVGAGISTDTGPRLRAGYRNNRANRKGHRFKSDIELSPVIQGIAAEYRIPLTDPRSDWMSYTAALSREDTDTFETDTASLGLRRSKRLGASWIRTLSLDVSYEEFTVGTDSDDSLLVLPALAFDHKYADRDLYPGRGRRLSAELRGTSDALGSNTSFLQAQARARWIHSLGAHSRLLVRGTAGVTAKSDFDELPPSVRFFAGGDESVRGFDFDSLGPADADGNVIGGSNLLVASIEYEQRLRGNFYGALFVDAGNAFEDFDVDPEVGAGLGLVWRSPVGPIKLYLGYPLTADDDRNIRVHLRLGADL